MNFKIDEMTDEEIIKQTAEFEKAEDEMKNLEKEGISFDTPKELDEKILKMIKEFENIELKKIRKKKKNRNIRAAALLFVCVALGMTAVTMNADAFKIKVFSILTKDHSEYIDIHMVESGQLTPEIKEMFPKEWESVFYPMELPDGYELVYADLSLGGNLKTMCFFNKSENKYISFDYVLNNTSDSIIDSENRELGYTKVKGKEALYSSDEESTILVWSDSGYEFCLICTEINVKDTVKIAESIVYVKLK